MPWFRIDDTFATHPKVLRVGNASIGLFVRLGSYCAQHLTDGRIPASIVRQFGTRAQLAALLREGLLERDGHDYKIRDYLDRNPSAAELKADKAATLERQRQWRARRVTNASPDTPPRRVTNGAPSHPSKNDLQLVDDSPPHPHPVDISSLIRKAP